MNWLNLSIGLLLVGWLLLPGNLAAQFAGGAGDGHDRRTIRSTTLDGIPVSTTVLYGGGAGDGFDHHLATFTPAGAPLSQLYGGGSGDGFDHSLTALTPAGTQLTQLYGGGPGDGFDHNLTTLTPTGTSLAQLYGGGDGDGFDRSLNTLTPAGTSVTQLYGGGDGDGFDANLMTYTPAGGLLSVLYGGGPGDGFDRSLTTLTPAGTELAQLYGGGRGDGHDAYLLSGGIVPLPLTLISFAAFPEDKYVLLRWVTADEQATDYFTIEKTREGAVFADVATVEAAGFSEPGEEIHYEARDEAPYEGTSFYRLVTTDLDGAVTFSHLVEVEYATARDWTFTAFPNPNTGHHLSVRPEGARAGARLRMDIYDASGRPLVEQRLEHQPGVAQRIDLPGKLAAGTYLLRLTQEDGTYQAKLLIVGRGN